MPGNSQVFSAAINAADRHRWESQWTEAAREYQKALTEFPEDATARSGIGFCFMQMKQWQKALDQYECILKDEPSNVIALSKTAELYGILNRREDAYTAYLHLADLYSQAGQGARAEAAWQKAVQLSPDNPEPHERLASYYSEKKDFAATIQQYLAAAQGYLLHNNYASARMQCEEVLRIDSINAQAQQLLSQMLGGPQRPPGSPPQGGGSFSSSTGSASGAGMPGQAQQSASLQALAGNLAAETGTPGNTSGGNTGIMGNMGSAGNFGGVSNPGPSLAMPGGGGGMNSAPHKRITANQVTGALKQAQTFQAQGRFDDAIGLCEQILESGFDRPDARYFLGWLYQEKQRWDEAIRQFQMLLNDPDYALSCYYALGQCYRARGDLRTAAVHFDEAVDRVNLDALTVEESDQLLQLCQEAAEAHRALGEQEQALTVYNALLGFLRSRGWSDKIAQVEFMLQQGQNTGMSARPTPPPNGMQQAPRTQPPTAVYQAPQSPLPEAPTMAFNAASIQPVAPPSQTSSSGELPDWLTGILTEGDKAQPAGRQTPPQGAKPIPEAPPRSPSGTLAKPQVQNPPSSPSWLTDGAKPAAIPSTAQTFPPEAPAWGGVQTPQPPVQPQPPAQPQPAVQPPPVQLSPVQPATQSVDLGALLTPGTPLQANTQDLLSQIAGSKDDANHGTDAIAASAAMLPENVRAQVIRSMRDIQKYIGHGLLTPATEECLRVIDMAPQYLDVHQVLGEIYVKQGKIEQAITKYGILVDTYVVNGRVDDAVTTYRRILQLDPNNLTYRMRLISLLSSHGNKEDLLRERTQAAEAYLRLGYMDRALTELEQALQESPTSVPTRLNYALALQKLGRTQQAATEYQRVLQVDPRNITALVRWHLAIITAIGTPRATSLEVLSRIRWQLRGEGQKHAEVVLREYQQAVDSYPNNADVQFSLGQIYHQSGLFDKAIDAYIQAMRDSSIEIMARTSAAQSLLLQGKPEAAIQQLEQALQVVRRSPASIDPATWAARPREEGEEHQAPEVEISLLLAKAYGRTGRQDQMQAIMRKVKQAKPGQGEISSTIAEISARQQGDIEGALREYMDLVRHYRNNRQTDNALGVLNEMVRLAPQDPRAHEELADIYINRGMLDEGIAELRLLADIHLRYNRLDDAGSAIQRVGNLYVEMGNNTEGLVNLCRAAELKPDSMELLREVVSFCLQQRQAQPQQSSKFQQEAVKYQTTIARHYVDTRQVKEAVAALQQLISIDRNNYDAYDMLGQAYQSVGEYEQASRVYRNLSKVNPGSTVARERLAALQSMRLR
ncbi:MAG TPA: tetratricopeptide repeat protein [Ktedonobacteraceae bacterium]|nr:tetratricopeptide repeat protein [Ktedonobacteraceae bacterium]